MRAPATMLVITLSVYPLAITTCASSIQQRRTHDDTTRHVSSQSARAPPYKRRTAVRGSVVGVGGVYREGPAREGVPSGLALGLHAPSPCRVCAVCVCVCVWCVYADSGEHEGLGEEGGDTVPVREPAPMVNLASCCGGDVEW